LIRKWLNHAIVLLRVRHCYSVLLHLPAVQAFAHGLRRTRRDRHANFGTEFVLDPFLGRNDHGFLFDDNTMKVCYLMGTAGELLDFDYFRSWTIAPTADHAFLFLTTDKNRPLIKISAGSLAEMTIWRRRLADLLPATVPATLAA
jgi:hypothetical protein